MTDLLLVPSPLLGPSTWASTASWLAAHGRTTRVVDTSGVRAPSDLVEVVVSAAGERPVVLVPHSNAGLAVPVLGTLIDVRATVFVDAALPLSESETAIAPPGLLAMLEGLADPAGVLPPWTEWWDDLTGVFPSTATRAEVEAGQPRLPLSYFTTTLPVPGGWSSKACAYLAFGDTYAEEIAFARAHRWPVDVLPGRHLHQLHDPAAVGEAVLALVESVER